MLIKKNHIAKWRRNMSGILFALGEMKGKKFGWGQTHTYTKIVSFHFKRKESILRQSIYRYVVVAGDLMNLFVFLSRYIYHIPV